MDGIVLINKEKGYTSQDVVSCVKKILNEKKVGHCGTLDPMATGVLPILVGNATKLSKYLIEHDKIYEAIIQLGKTTDTGDMEGNIIAEEEVNSAIIEENLICKVLNSFLGESYQVPPMYSAIKVNGKKLYEYAREGIEIDRKPRKITIYEMESLNIDNIKKQIKIRVKCSKGTYIRTLCEDIAKKIGTIGTMEELKRIEVNNFKLENSSTLKEFEKAQKYISIEDYYKNYNNIDIITLDENKLKLFENGTLLYLDKNDGLYRIYCNNIFVGLGIINDKKLKRDIVL